MHQHHRVCVHKARTTTAATRCGSIPVRKQENTMYNVHNVSFPVRRIQCVAPHLNKQLVHRCDGKFHCNSEMPVPKPGFGLYVTGHLLANSDILWHVLKQTVLSNICWLAGWIDATKTTSILSKSSPVTHCWLRVTGE